MAVSWIGTAVSHDGGATFSTTSVVTASTNFYDYQLVPRPQGDRVIALLGDKSLMLPMYSDDWGKTWTAATLPAPVAQSTYVPTLGRISDGRYIAYASVPGTSRSVFICSADGASWSICTPV
jgi:hypothetical protein